MQSENNEHQKIMQTKGKDINFIPNVGFGKIQFEYDEFKTINILGEQYIKTVDAESEISRYNYGHFTTNFHYEKDEYDYMSIHLNDLILEGINISILSEIDFIDFIKSYYNKHKILFEYKLEKSEFEKSYYFKDIGLTVWYEASILSDICIHKAIL